VVECPPSLLKARNELAGSGAVERMLKAGNRAPDFSLPSTRGRTVRPFDLLQTGPVVIAYYRGHIGRNSVGRPNASPTASPTIRNRSLPPILVLCTAVLVR